MAIQTKNITIPALFLALLLSMSGCKTDLEHKTQADQDTYDVIETNWNINFDNPPTDYQIQDQHAEPNALEIAQILGPNNQLTLDNSIELAFLYNRDYQRQREALYIRALDFTQIRHLYEMNFFAILQGGYSREGDDEATGAEGTIGGQQLLSSGAFLASRVGVAWVDILTGDMRNGLATLFDISITQPLLRGSDKDIVLEPLTQADRDTLYQIRTFQRYRQTLAVAVASEYYRVLQQSEEVDFAQQNAETLTQACHRLEKLAAVGRLPQFELDQANQDRLEAQDILLRTTKNYQQALDQLKLTLNVSPQLQFQLTTDELKLLRETLPQQPDITPDQAVATAHQQRLDLMNQEDQIADAQRKVNVARDQLQAELNLFARSNLTSKQRTDLFSFDNLDDQLIAGIELDLPLDRLAERNAYRKSLINLTQSQRRYDEATDQITVEIRRSHRNFTEALDRYRVQKQSHTLAQKRYTNTRALLQYARTSTRDLLDAQEDLFATQNALIESQVDYMVAILEFSRDSGNPSK